MQGPSEKIANYKPRSKPHQTLNWLDFQAHRTMRNNFLLYINHPIYDILLQQLEYTDTRLETRQDCLLSPLLFHMKQGKYIKSLQIGKEKRTLDLFTGDIIIYGEIPNEFTRKLL